MKKIVAGMISISLLLSSGLAAAASGQYSLTKVSYPIVVDGKEYQNPIRPILNYNGSTYIPLSNIAELTGVTYKWNKELKQVEIGSTPTASSKDDLTSGDSIAYAQTVTMPKLLAKNASDAIQDLIDELAEEENNNMLTENAETDALRELQKGPAYYILTEVAYPVVVNSKKYSDKKNPILNYDGSTYIPLAKIGELTGVQYKWNTGLKQVEIVSSPAASTPTSTPTSDDSMNEILEKIEAGGNVYN